MKKLYIYSLLLCLLFLFNFKIKAQDLHYSQFEANPFFLNPALVGISDAKYRVFLHHRHQWKAISTPFVTNSIGVDTKFKLFQFPKTRLGLGLQLNKDEAGDSNFSNQIMNWTLAIHQEINNKVNLSFACLLNYHQFGMNINNLRFNNQYDGLKYNSNLDHKETLSIDNDFLMDFALSTNINYRFERKKYFNIGFSCFHINTASLSFFENKDVKLRRKYSFYMNSRFNFNGLDIYPSLFYTRQHKFNELIFGGKVKFEIYDFFVQGIYTGIWHRWKDSEIIFLGFEFMDFDMGISYDLNTSKLINASNFRGAFELSLIYSFGKLKQFKEYYKENCPVFI